MRVLIEQCQNDKAQIDDRAIGVVPYIATDIGQSMRRASDFGRLWDGAGVIMTPSAIRQYRPQGAASRRQFLNPTEPSKRLTENESSDFS